MGVSNCRNLPADPKSNEYRKKHEIGVKLPKISGIMELDWG